MMRVLSLSRPWTWSLFDPIAAKGIENRTWPPPVEAIGHRIAIQAAKSWDNDAIGFFLRLGIDHFPARKDQYPSGVVIGVVTLDRVVTSDRLLPPDQRRWFFGPYGWVITDRILLPTPVECSGALGLRYLDPAREAAVDHQLGLVP